MHAQLKQHEKYQRKKNTVLTEDTQLCYFESYNI